MSGSFVPVAVLAFVATTLVTSVALTVFLRWRGWRYPAQVGFLAPLVVSVVAAVAIDMRIEGYQRATDIPKGALIYSLGLGIPLLAAQVVLWNPHAMAARWGVPVAVLVGLLACIPALFIALMLACAFSGGACL